MCALFACLYIGWMYILSDLSKALSPVGSTKLSFVIKSPQIPPHRGHIQHMIKRSTAATYLFKGTWESRWDTFFCSLCILMSECDATEVMTFDGAGRNSGWWVIIPLNDKFAQADSEPRLKKKKRWMNRWKDFLWITARPFLKIAPTVTRMSLVWFEIEFFSLHIGSNESWIGFDVIAATAQQSSKPVREVAPQ